MAHLGLLAIFAVGFFEGYSLIGNCLVVVSDVPHI